MRWWFYGEGFTWQIDADGELSLDLDVSWHAPIPDMGGRVPELQLEQVEDLFGRELRIRYLVGDAKSLVRKAQELTRIQGSFVSTPDFDPCGMLWVFQDKKPTAELSVYVKLSILENLLESFQIYAAMLGAKCFGGNLSGYLLFGPQIKGATDEIWTEFFNGDRPAFISELPSLNFASGKPLPEPMSWNDILGELKTQF